jgi:hypothetical protein
MIEELDPHIQEGAISALARKVAVRVIPIDEEWLS